MHDPFQSHQMFGAYSGVATPFGIPYGGQQIPALTNPAFAGYTIHPQQLQQLQQLQHLQMLQQLQGQAQIPQFAGSSPFVAGLQHPLLQNPLAANPQLLNPTLAHQGWPQQQVGYPLAPQSLMGVGIPFGNNPALGMHPLAAQLTLRALSGGAIAPLGY